MFNQKTVYPAAFILMLAACSENNIKDENSVFYAVPPGSTLVLKRTLTIRGDQVAVYVQDGEVMRYRDVNFYSPNCKFEI